MLLLYSFGEGAKKHLAQIGHWQTKGMIPYKSGLVNRRVCWEHLEEAGWLGGSCMVKSSTSAWVLRGSPHAPQPSTLYSSTCSVPLQPKETEESDVWSLQWTSNDPSPLLFWGNVYRPNLLGDLLWVFTALWFKTAIVMLCPEDSSTINRQALPTYVLFSNSPLRLEGNWQSLSSGDHTALVM